MIHIAHETAAEVMARESLLDACFGPSRFTKASELLRTGRLPAEGLSLAAMDGDALVGTVRLWHVDAGTAGPALLLGPLGVAPDRQGRGIGRMLMAHAVDEAEALGHRAVLLVGDASYYARFGFTDAFTRSLAMPGRVDPARFLGLELVPGALIGARGDVVATGLPEPMPFAATGASGSARTAAAANPIPNEADWPEVATVAA